MEILFLAAFVIIIICMANKQYKKTEYFQQTKNSYSSVRFNKGLSGEYYTYKCLRSLSGYKRFLYNRKVLRMKTKIQ